MYYNEKRDAQKLGALGEEMVAEYLRKNGYIVIKRNFKSRFGEIDIIAETKTEIIFVEVKTRTENSLVSGVEAVDFYKAERIRKTALGFLSRIKVDLAPRFDVAEVTVYNRPDNSVGYKLKYVKSAF
ncbi:MAG: YraN family protein [Oscillospiraceae bacterium]|nr:YraN family protein [Oscillospiraceae bacterium]